jgi:hypothetical protein
MPDSSKDAQDDAKPLATGKDVSNDKRLSAAAEKSKQTITEFARTAIKASNGMKICSDSASLGTVRNKLRRTGADVQ